MAGKCWQYVLHGDHHLRVTARQGLEHATGLVRRISGFVYVVGLVLMLSRDDHMKSWQFGTGTGCHIAFFPHVHVLARFGALGLSGVPSFPYLGF